MTFAWPHLLWLLLAPAALLAWDLKRRRHAAAASSHPKILRVEAGANSVRVTGNRAPLRQATGVRAWLCAGLVLAVVALARPQWGRLEIPVFEQAREILLAVDLSRSMLTPDVKPSRLDRAKLLIQSLLEKLAGERVGLVVFSGTAFLQSPLSADYEILREFLPALGPKFLPEGGTNYRALIDTSLDAFGDSGAADRFLIILSDGEATEDEWRARMGELRKRNIRVIGLGVGTAAGAMIPDGSGAFVKDERGAVVLSRLESRTLQELAASTEGAYRDASAWVDLAALLRETVEAGQKGQFVEKNTIRMVERFQWPLAFALWCFFVSLWYEFPVRPRPRAISVPGRPQSRGPGTAAQPGAAGKSLAAGVGLLVALLLSPPALPASRGAATQAKKPAGAPAAAAASEPELSPLGRIVGRLAAAPQRTARDWAELARETVIWGSQLKTEKQTVPEGPVRDALGAVDLGSKLDARTADWAKLRSELEALLQKPEPPPEEQQKDQQQQQQNQEQQDKDDRQKQQQQQSADPQQNQQKQQERDDQQQNQSENQDSKPEQKPPGESAFGDMKEKSEPPPPPNDTQKVGGAPEKKDEAPEPADPSLALPLQKLEQLRAQDSPAQLFQLMEGEKKQPAKKSGKDW